MPGVIWSHKERASIVHQILILGIGCSKVTIPGRTSRAVYHQIQELRKQKLLPKSVDRHYGHDEEHLLVSLIRQGRKLKDIRIPGRSPQSMYGHIKLLRRKGFRQLKLRRTWTRSEDQQLLFQVATLGRSPKQVAVDGRSRKSIYNRIKVLRREGRITRYFRKLTPARKWGRREIAELLQASGLYGQHRGAVSLKKAGLFPQRTVPALSRMISLCGLADPAKSQAVKTRLKLTPEQKLEFHEWLREEGRHLPTALVAKRFGFREDFVTHFRQRHGLQVNPRKALRCQVYRVWHAAQVSKRVQARIAVYRRNRADRLSQMTHLDAILRSLHSKKTRRKCRACGKGWFATRDFFRLRTYCKNDRQRFSFDYLCWACPATNRVRVHRPR